MGDCNATSAEALNRDPVAAKQISDTCGLVSQASAGHGVDVFTGNIQTHNSEGEVPPSIQYAADRRGVRVAAAALPPTSWSMPNCLDRRCHDTPSRRKPFCAQDFLWTSSGNL